MRPQLLLATLTALASASCYPAGDGQAPPLDQLYFPTGLALESTHIAEPDESLARRLVPSRFLYVASSDFDLQYRSSGLISFNLETIAAAVPRNCSTSEDCNGSGAPQMNRCDIPKEVANVPDLPANYVPSYVCVPKADLQPCGSVGEQGAADRLLYPGRCKPLDQHPFIRSTVGIGAFATDVVFAEEPQPMTGEPRKRLFLPVRGDATLHWIDLNDGLLECDQQSTSDGSCGDSHRAGHEPSASNNNDTQPSEPFGIAVTERGDYVAMTNQTSGSVSLYTHDWNSAVGPQLVNIVSGLPQAPVAIAAVPQVFESDPAHPDYVPYLPPQGFLVAYRNAAQIDLLRVQNDVASGNPDGNYNRYSLAYAGTAPIALNSLGYDSRDIVIDDRERKEGCPDKSGTPDYPCLRAAKQPSVYIANRTPASLLVGAMASDASYATGSSDLPAFTASVPLTPGPSRLVRGAVKVPAVAHAPDATHGFTDEHGSFDLEPRVFIVCFDSTRIYVYDPTRHVIDSIIDTGRGPYALAIDEARGLGYVGFFTDSYLGVISLDQRYPKTYASVIANIGPHTPPRSSK